VGRGLSHKQQRILELLDEDGTEHIRVRELRNRVAGSAQALSRSISRLVGRGLVERVSIMEGERAMPAVRKKLNR